MFNTAYGDWDCDQFDSYNQLTVNAINFILFIFLQDELPGRQAGRHDWFYYTSTKCAIPDDMSCQNIYPETVTVFRHSQAGIIILLDNSLLTVLTQNLLCSTFCGLVHAGMWVKEGWNWLFIFLCWMLLK
jgi:hypothetical protein